MSFISDLVLQVVQLFTRTPYTMNPGDRYVPHVNSGEAAITPAETTKRATSSTHLRMLHLCVTG